MSFTFAPTAGSHLPLPHLSVGANPNTSEVGFLHGDVYGTMSHLRRAGLDEADEPDEPTPAAKGSLNPLIFFLNVVVVI